MNRRRFLLTTGAGSVALLYSDMPLAFAARGENPMTGHTLLFNQDCNDVDGTAAGQPSGTREQFIRDWYRRAFSAGVGVFVADVTTGPVVETKDTPTGEVIGARFAPEVRKGIHWVQTIDELFAQGTDVLHLACEEARRANATILGGARMSDAHHGGRWQAESDDPLFPQIVMDHPEWCNTWQDGSLDATLNYNVPQVREHYLAILREMATNYDIDGLELDWMRFCRHFPAGRQREHLDDLTHFVHEVHLMLREVARDRGRERLILGHRVAATVEECLNIGCDVGTWAQRGYADYLAPMEFFNHDVNVMPDEFATITADTGCLVYPGFGRPQYSYSSRYPFPMRSLAEFRALARNIYAFGGAGASVFNMYLWPPEEHEFRAAAIAILSDPQRAAAGPRHYIYVPSGAGAGPTGKDQNQSIVFGPDSTGNRHVYTFRMADGKDGEKLSGLLRLRICDAGPEDEFTLDIGGETVDPSSIRSRHFPQGEPSEQPAEPLSLPGAPFTWPAGLRLEVPLRDCPAFAGDNELGITMVSKVATGRDAPVMEALEVKVDG